MSNKNTARNITIKRATNLFAVMIWLTLVLLMAGKGVNSHQLDPPAFTITPEMAQRLFEARCAPCHGPTGKGRRSLAPKAPDFTEPSWQYSKTDEELVFAILNGIGIGAGSMPGWKRLLTEAEIKALVAYVRTLSGRSDEEITSEVVQRIYRARCISCHGSSGKGRRRRTPQVPDFTNSQWQYSKTDNDLQISILKGIGKGKDAMPKWEGLVSEQEAQGLVRYIRSFNR
jgi:cytochrome c oxidase cbb3-type subunit III